MYSDYPSLSEAIRKCALECSARRINRTCRNEFDSIACNDCVFFIKKYTNPSASNKMIDLYMLNTDMDVDAFMGPNHGLRLLYLVIIILVIAAGFILWRAGDEKDRNLGIGRYRTESVTPAPVVTARTTTVPARTNTTSQASSTMQMIETALTRTAAELRRGVDVNGDGLINCIDAAVLFYGFFPDKSKVTITVNRNAGTDFHHLFNVVNIDGVWRAIEPQAYWTNQRSIYMRDVWVDRYDANLNRTVTNDYLRFVRNR